MRKWVKIALWILFVGGVISLLVIIERQDRETILSSPDIQIGMTGDDPFLNEQEVLSRLERAHLIYEGQRKEDLRIAAIEKLIKSISHVKNAEVYVNYGSDWIIRITLRKPIARIFNSSGETYYLDDEGNKMDRTSIHTAHVLVVTGKISDRRNSENVSEIINNDSLISIRKLDDIYRISNYVCTDTLFRSLIAQLHVEKNGDFVLIPVVGEQKIIFGSATTEKEVEEKFGKLKVFYKEAMPYEGWDKYSEISLKFKDQIVCKKAGEL